jgi:hypothetical protein
VGRRLPGLQQLPIRYKSYAFRMHEPAAPLSRTDRFDWTLVRSFLAVLDAGSLMGAARRWGRSSPR